MRAYIVKRLLIMIPTFLGISLVVFLIVNLAPGSAVTLRSGGDIEADLKGEKTQESIRIFRETFNLDKPILFNARFRLDRNDIEDRARAIARIGNPTQAEQLHAYDDLIDYGYFAVPHLIDIVRETDDDDLRRTAVSLLVKTARRPLPYPNAEYNEEEKLAANREVLNANARIRRWRYDRDTPEEEKQRITQQWFDWFEENQSRWDRSWLDNAYTFLVETRFAHYWINLAQLDFGVSMITREPVLRTLASKLKYSITLSIGSLLLAYLISIPIGIYSAVRKDTISDRIVTVALFMLYSLPSFFVATLLLVYFSKASDYEFLRWFPIGGWESGGLEQKTTLEQLGDIAYHLVLPIFCLTYGALAALSRYMRAGLLDVIRSDYIRTARAKGLPERVVVLKHAVRNGLLPVLTLLAGLAPAILGGSVVIEYIFNIPGIGLWTISAIQQRDYNVVMAVTLISALLTMIGILLSDLSYALVDPRISYQ